MKRFLTTIDVLVVVGVALVLFSCSDQPRDGYTWVKEVPALTKYEWHVIDQAELNARCEVPTSQTANGCVERHWGTDTCHVYSTYTEAAARAFKPAGTFGKTSLFEHEVWDDQANPKLGHCAGYGHKEAYLPGPGTNLGVIHG